MSRYFIVEPAQPPASTPVYDYTNSYSAILSELNDIDVDTTSLAASVVLIAASLSTMAANSTIMAEKITAMETYQKKLKELGEGPGIHIIGPYDWIGLVALYKLFIEEGDILDVSDDVSADQSAAALAKFNDYIDKIRALPTLF